MRQNRGVPKVFAKVLTTIGNKIQVSHYWAALGAIML